MHEMKLLNWPVLEQTQTKRAVSVVLVFTNVINYVACYWFL